VAAEPDPAGVHDDELAAALCELLEVGRGHGVVLDRVGADDDGDLGILDLVEGGGHRGGADILHQRRHGARVAEPGAVVDVVVAEGLADELLEEVGLLVGAFRRAEAGDGLAAVGVAQREEALGCAVEGLVPGRLAEVDPGVRGIDVEALRGRVVAADQGLVSRWGWAT
jgi:hypothetical protein